MNNLVIVNGVLTNNDLILIADLDSVVLIQDGVYNLLTENDLRQIHDVHVLEVDLAARNINMLDTANPPTIIDYDEFVNLTLKHKTVITL